MGVCEHFLKQTSKLSYGLLLTDF